LREQRRQEPRRLGPRRHQAAQRQAGGCRLALVVAQGQQFQRALAQRGRRALVILLRQQQQVVAGGMARARQVAMLAEPPQQLRRQPDLLDSRRSRHHRSWDFPQSTVCSIVDKPPLVN
jgi:hypothetical protein